QSKSENSGILTGFHSAPIKFFRSMLSFYQRLLALRWPLLSNENWQFQTRYKRCSPQLGISLTMQLIHSNIRLNFYHLFRLLIIQIGCTNTHLGYFFEDGMRRGFSEFAILFLFSPRLILRRNFHGNNNCFPFGKIESLGAPENHTK